MSFDKHLPIACDDCLGLYDSREVSLTKSRRPVKSRRCVTCVTRKTNFSTAVFLYDLVACHCCQTFVSAFRT
jgi:hypothetical protein